MTAVRDREKDAHAARIRRRMDATAAVQASQFTCQVEWFGLVMADGGALSAWREVGRNLGATLNADVVHWPAHRPVAATVDVLVPAARHEDVTESFYAARTLARLG